MGKSCFSMCRSGKTNWWLKLMLGLLVILIVATISSVSKMVYSTGFFLPGEALYRREGNIDFVALTARVKEVLDKMESLQDNLESTVQQLEKFSKKELLEKTMSLSEHKRFLENKVIRPLYTAHIALRQIRLPTLEENGSTTLKEDPLINSFAVEEIRKYITPKENVYNTIGHACVLMKTELEEYMSYDVGSYCNDDWILAQKLMVHGCDPLPRRRCLARASKLYTRPYSINESLWKIPDGRNVRWSNYQCGNFKCLSGKNPRRGYSECSSCFELEKEKQKWVINANASLLSVDFLIEDILRIKPGEIRIGLDHGVGTGTFAARMKEQKVNIITTALNLGAPFNEMIALRGLIPLYVTLNQRLPFFDNTMDMIHTRGFVDGWMDLQLLDFVLFDWDRVLRPGGLLWIDRFYCKRKELDEYMYMFLQFRYRKHKWAIAPKSKDEVFLSALLEKPRRS